MIFCLQDPEQRAAFYEKMMTHQLLYGKAYAVPLGGSLVFLIETWVNPAAVR
jgi:phage portal protein BeeE